MAIDDVYQLGLLQTFAGQQCMNTLAFRMKTAPDPSQVTAQALADDWKNFIKGLQVATVTHTGWTLQQVRGGTVSYSAKPCQRDGGRRLEGGYTGAVTGDVIGEGLPPQAAMVVTLSTGFSGRRRRGRFYQLGLSENTQIDGTFGTSTMSSANGLWAAQFAQYGVGGTDPNFELGVWSHTTASGCTVSKTPPFKPTPSASPDPAGAYLGCVGVTLRNIVYSQRRRTIGVGR